MNVYSIIVGDRSIVHDGFAVHEVDMSAIDPAINAIQYYPDINRVDIEYHESETGIKPPNVETSDVSSFQHLLDVWANEKAHFDAYQLDNFAHDTVEQAKERKADHIQAEVDKAIAAILASNPVGAMQNPYDERSVILQSLLPLATLRVAAGDTLWTAKVIDNGVVLDYTAKMIVDACEVILEAIRQVREAGQSQVDMVNTLTTVPAIRDLTITI